MYQRVLLASDESREGLVALREGALLAQRCAAKVFLLIVTRETPGLRIANAVYPLPDDGASGDLLALGLARLESLGLATSGEVRLGEPAQVIAAKAREFAADLVVVGHRRQSFIDRWWGGDEGAYLIDHLDCSVLVARNRVSDAEFETELARLAAPPGHGDPQLKSCTL